MKTLADMHIHSNNSHDAVSPIDDICESAIEKGISMIAITDHLDIEFFGEKDIFSSIRSSHTDVMVARERYGDKLDILAGVEISEYIWHPEYAKQCLEALNYDVIIGSVHTVRFDGGKTPYSWMDFSTMPIETVYRFVDTYFDDLTESINSFNFDILAHLTCPLRYINGKYGRGVDIHKYDDKIDTILKLVIEKDIALEVNTSGFGTSVGFMPDETVVKRYTELGGTKVTLGSDAHTAQNIGKGFDMATEMLKINGIDCIYSFPERKPVRHRID